jgi:hypothetical protein
MEADLRFISSNFYPKGYRNEECSTASLLLVHVHSAPHKLPVPLPNSNNADTAQHIVGTAYGTLHRSGIIDCFCFAPPTPKCAKLTQISSNLPIKNMLTVSPSCLPVLTFK